MATMADLIRKLLEAGVEPSALADIVECVEEYASRDASRDASRFVTCDERDDWRDARQKAAERARAYRERKKRDASRDASQETSRDVQSLACAHVVNTPSSLRSEGDYSVPSLRSETGAAAPPAAPEPVEADDRKALYDRAKRILGKSYGSLVTNLLKAVNGSVPEARSILEKASLAAVPSDYLAGAIRKRAPAGPEQVELFDPATRSPDVWRKAVASWRRGGTWAFGHEGPAPNELGTLVPDAILTEFGITPSREPMCNRFEDASQPAVEARYRQMKAAMREKREAMA